jgi:antitoxin (DNA-binding transcriptional repressor) of toxin-antitoxin stability system
MQKINIHDAKTNLSRLVDQAAQGESFVIAKAAQPAKLSKAAQKLIKNREHILYFSAASLWEISIKNGLGCTDFSVDPACCAGVCWTMTMLNCPYRRNMRCQ